MVTSVSSSGAVILDRPTAVRLSHEGDQIIVWLDGEHDVSTRSALSRTLETAFAASGGDVVVDLSGVTFIAAGTIGALLRGRNALLSQSRNLTLRSPSRPARRILEALDLTNLVEPNE